FVFPFAEPTDRERRSDRVPGNIMDLRAPPSNAKSKGGCDKLCATLNHRRLRAESDLRVSRFPTRGGSNESWWGRPGCRARVQDTHRNGSEPDATFEHIWPHR